MMKNTTLFLVLLVVFSTLVIAGCTTTPAPVPTPTATIVPTPVPAAVVTVATTAPLTDPALTGSWTLKGMMVGGGTSTTIPSTQITLTFKNDGTLSGFGGCNNYNANYVLTGRTTSFGKTISIGPGISTQKFCAGTSDQESAYLANLQKAETYSITTNNMMIRTSTLSQLSYVNGLG
jgi:heat shock protein HslJ